MIVCLLFVGERGTDLRDTQAVLEDSSSKTTEIYTHITTKGLDGIIPITIQNAGFDSFKKHIYCVAES